jgi:hypothetical protein
MPQVLELRAGCLTSLHLSQLLAHTTKDKCKFHAIATTRLRPNVPYRLLYRGRKLNKEMMECNLYSIFPLRVHLISPSTQGIDTPTLQRFFIVV